MAEDIIPLKSFHKRFRHSVALGTAYRGKAAFHSKLTGKVSGFQSGKAGAVIRQPLHGLAGSGGMESGFHTGQQHTLRHVRAVATGRRGKGHHFPVTAVHSKKSTYPFPVVTDDFKTIRTPAVVTGRNHYLSSMAASGIFTGITGQQQIVSLHDSVHPFVVNGRISRSLKMPITQSQNPTIPIGRMACNHIKNQGQQRCVIRFGIGASLSGRTALLLVQMGTGNRQGLGNPTHWKSSTPDKGASEMSFFRARYAPLP